jgi:hypothetical protein
MSRWADPPGPLPPDLARGERVQLRYRGYRGVPLYLADTWATVVGWTARGLIVVRADLDGRERKIRVDEMRRGFP